MRRYWYISLHYEKINNHFTPVYDMYSAVLDQENSSFRFRLPLWIEMV